MSSSAFVHLVSGAASGVLSLAITYPLYCATITIQSNPSSSSSSTPSLSISNRGVIGTLVRLFEQEGLKGWYKGLKAALVAVAVQQGVYYYFFQMFKNLHSISSSSSPSWQILVGFEAGAGTVLATNPLWLINAKQITMTRKSIHTNTSSSSFKRSQPPLPQLQQEEEDGYDKIQESLPVKNGVISKSQDVEVMTMRPKDNASKSAGLIGLMKRILSSEGIGGLYAGVIPALMLTTNPASQFFIYELLKKWIIQIRIWGWKKKLIQLLTEMRIVQNLSSGTNAMSVDVDLKNVTSFSAWDIFVLGALAKIASTALTYPIQTVKTHMQRANSEHTQVSECFESLYASGGIRAFYSGLNSKLLQTGFTAAFMFLFHDQITRAIARRIPRKK